MKHFYSICNPSVILPKFGNMPAPFTQGSLFLSHNGKKYRGEVSRPCILGTNKYLQTCLISGAGHRLAAEFGRFNRRCALQHKKWNHIDNTIQIPQMDFCQPFIHTLMNGLPGQVRNRFQGSCFSYLVFRSAL